MSKMIMKIYRLSEKENESLKKAAEKASMTEAQFIRSLISGYHPPESPDERFFEDMEELKNASNNLADSIRRLRSEGVVLDVQEEVAGLKNLRLALMKKYLLGERRKV